MWARGHWLIQRVGLILAAIRHIPVMETPYDKITTIPCFIEVACRWWCWKHLLKAQIIDVRKGRQICTVEFPRGSVNIPWLSISSSSLFLWLKLASADNNLNSWSRRDAIRLLLKCQTTGGCGENWRERRLTWHLPWMVSWNLLRAKPPVKIPRTAPGIAIPPEVREKVR